MVRITKLTDYAMVVLALMAAQPLRLFQAREIAEQTTLPPTTVSKLLKNLTKNKFLRSERGAAGGYRLEVDPEQISIADLIDALEGPLAITECNLGHDHCRSETHCSLRTPWIRINHIITRALASITLSDLIQPKPFIGEHYGK